MWVIDPIDGTHNFLTGIPFWCVSVGLVASGELGEIAFATAMRFAADSLLEGKGFELSVPLQRPTAVDFPGSAAGERREGEVGPIIWYCLARSNRC